MSMQDMKIYALNTSSLAISFTDIDTILKVVLLLVSIGYTVNKWYLMNKKNK
jgi:hypothetical protein|tara:strand:+ start:435 stop:590 length:156 start_codon:yes stop_codon:yes gene_type:complete